jgi:uncharacterized protein DUF1553/uncharacterized protein DUF1549/cytochrome c
MRSTVVIFALATAALATAADYRRDIEPLLSSRCYMCHGVAQQMNGLRLDREADAMKGGYSGAVILPGNSAGSRLVKLVSNLEEGLIMPPAGGKLTDAEIKLIRDWIDQGAEWPEQIATAEPAKPVTTRQSDHWSFQPPRRGTLPTVRDASSARNPIDTFVLARLEADDIKPSPAASKQTLIRRLSLDITGLPPSPERVTEFLADTRDDAYERLVDELLASKHYGEKWAMHWLDLARYADSDGYEKDQTRPHAWRWRHWVIDALNRDMPFDRFTIEQISADLLPGATPAQKIATGFHRNTLTNREGGVEYEQFRFEETVDRANTVSSVWLGLTMGCSQCHDHKFDPISQKDYYNFAAFFHNLEIEHIDAPVPGEVGPYLRSRDEYLGELDALLESYNAHTLQREWEEKLREAVANPGRWTDWDLNYDTLQKMSDGGHKILFIPADERTFKQQEIIRNYFTRFYAQVVPSKRYKKLKFSQLRKDLVTLENSYPQLSQSRVVYESEKPEQAHLHIRGAWDRKGIPVEPATPSVLPPLETSGQATRLDLAEWLVSRDNPLTARVTVNRIWQEYFGSGLVVTSEDFGTQGEKPSHPRLLDWLAVEFMDSGWGLKHLHKTIVMSATYRQSSAARPELETRDPDNALLARQARLRLPAELVRDNTLAVSGLLYQKLGGPSVKPPMPDGVAELGYANSVKWDVSTGADAYRRGLYIHMQRTVPYPFLMNFDSSDHTLTNCRRDRSNTPLQALNLLNDPVFFEAAQALAARVSQAPARDFETRLDYAYRICLARAPRPDEVTRLRSYFDAQQQLFTADAKAAGQLFPATLKGETPVEMAAWVGLSRVLLNLDEFITRE